MEIEKIMIQDGWKVTKYKNAGKVYVEFHKNGLIIDLDDINEDLR